MKVSKPTSINSDILPELIASAKASKRKRAMYCLHESNDSMLHTMINVICKDSYICPHKHWIQGGSWDIKKGESYLIIEWRWKLLFFDDLGSITETINIDSSQNTMALVPEGVWHSILSLSEYIVIYENKTWPWVEWKDKQFHSKFPLEWEQWVEWFLQEWYKL